MKQKSYNFLGISFYSRKEDENKKVQKILGIPVAKRKRKGDYLYYSILGIPIYRKKKVIPKKKKVVSFNETAPILTLDQYIKYKKQPKELLIVAPDHIGDYILRRNFFALIKESEKYQNHRLVFLGDHVCRAFAEYLDGELVDQFIWTVDRPSDYNAENLEHERILLHQKKGLKQYYDSVMVLGTGLEKNKLRAYNHLISGVASRERIIYGFDPEVYRHLHPQYTRVYIGHKHHRLFVFNRDKAFFEDILDQQITYTAPFIEAEKIPQTSVDSNYIAIAPYAQAMHKTWHRNNWVEFIIALKEKVTCDICILCSASEEDMAISLRDELMAEGIHITIFAGRPIPELITIIHNAKLLVSIDSGIFHLAAALKKRAICLTSGFDYFSFLQYPQEETHVKVVFPHGVKEWIHESPRPYPSYHPPQMTLNGLKINEVIKEVMDML